MPFNWIWDPESSSGGRHGGSASEHAFKGRIDTLVREVIQNSLDVRDDPNKPVSVVFRVVELSGKSLKGFLDAIKWEHLQDNLSAAAEERGGTSIGAALEQMQETDTLRLLVIEDHNTTGLTGAEHRTGEQEETNNFCALVKDVLYSDKSDEQSGGSFGLGKALLWAYSGFKTVFFASSLVECPENAENPRVIGRCSLPWHQTDEDGPCDGSGWFGEPAQRTSGDRKVGYARSIWGDKALRLSKAFHCERDPEDYGLSAVITGFAEPGEEDRELRDVAEDIVNKVTESFWPAVATHRLRVTVAVESDGRRTSEQIIDLSDGSPYKILAEMLEAYMKGETKEGPPQSPEDIVSAEVPITIPQRETPEDPHPQFDGNAVLVLRLLDEGDAPPEVRDKVFAFRGTGMVVRETHRSNLSITARPYAAALLCGRFSGEGLDEERVEAFLKAAEPPAHDAWIHDTRTIKANYRSHGTRKMLKDFNDAARAKISELVSVPEEAGGAPPEALRRHLRFGVTGGGGHKRFASVRRQTAERQDDGTWSFGTECRRLKKSERPWQVIVKIKFGSEGAAGEVAHCIQDLEVDTEGCEARIENGVGIIDVPGGIGLCSFTGLTDTRQHPPGAGRAVMKLKVDAKETGGFDA